MCWTLGVVSPFVRVVVSVTVWHSGESEKDGNIIMMEYAIKSLEFTVSRSKVQSFAISTAGGCLQSQQRWDHCMQFPVTQWRFSSDSSFEAENLNDQVDL